MFSHQLNFLNILDNPNYLYEKGFPINFPKLTFFHQLILLEDMSSAATSLILYFLLDW